MVRPTPPSDARERWRRVGWIAAAHTGAKIVSGLCLLAQVPLLLGYLGTDLFGWLMAMLALVSLATFADLGVGIALQNAFASAFGQADQVALRLHAHAGLHVLTRLAGAWIALGLLFLVWGSSRILVPPASVGPGGAFGAWTLILLLVGLQLPLAVGLRLAAGLQEGWRVAGWTAAANLGALALTAVGVRLHAPALFFLAVLGGAQVLPGLALTGGWLRRRLGSGPPLASPAIRTKARHLWRGGRRLAGPNLAGGVLQAALPLAFAAFGGYQANAVFSLLQRLFQIVVQVQATLLGPLWSAYTEAAIRSDWHWIRQAFRASLFGSFLLATVPLFLTAALPWIMEIWTAATAPPVEHRFAWLVALATSLTLAGHPYGLLVTGLNRLPRLAGPLTVLHLATALSLGLAGAWAGVWGLAIVLVSGAAAVAISLAREAYRGLQGQHDLERPTEPAEKRP